MLFYPNDTLTNKISFYHLVLFAMLLPFDQFYSELVLVSFLLHTLISLKKGSVKNIFRKEVLLLTSVFLVAVVCTFYTANKQEGFKLLSRQLAILLFPVLFSLTAIDLKKYTRTILLTFAMACTLAVAYLYADAFRIIRYHHLSFSALLSPAFMNHHFSEPIDMHATYLALYLGLSFAVFIEAILKTNRSQLKWLYATGASVLAAGLIQLGSRSVVIALLLFLVLAVPWFLKNKKAYLLGLLLLVAAAAIAFSVSAPLKARYIQLLEEDLSSHAGDYSVADPRVKRWQLAFELVKQSPLVGYGSGDEVDLLKQTYFRHQLYDSYLHRLNAHNQYLSYLLMGGIGALAVYVLTLCYGLRLAWRQKNLVLIAFLLLLATVSVSENFLFRNKGIFFYSFFFSLFVAAGTQQRIKYTPTEKRVSTGNRKSKISVSIQNS